MVALTGIEPAGYQFSSVPLGLSSCVFGLVQFATRAFRAVWMADVLPRDQDSVAQDPRFPCARVIQCSPTGRVFLARVIQPPPTTGNGALCSISVLNATLAPQFPWSAIMRTWEVLWWLG